MLLWTVTKIFGVDAVKTRVFRKREDAVIDIEETINLLTDDTTKLEVIEKENDEVYYILNKSSNPENFIEFILRLNEVR